MGPDIRGDGSVAAGRYGDERQNQHCRIPTRHSSLEVAATADREYCLSGRPGVSVPPHTPILTRTWTLRGRPTDAPLKNAPFKAYFLSNTLSTYTWGRSTVFPTTNA